MQSGTPSAGCVDALSPMDAPRILSITVPSGGRVTTALSALPWDGSAMFYVTGWTSRRTFPSAKPLQSALGSQNAFGQAQSGGRAGYSSYLGAMDPTAQRHKPLTMPEHHGGRRYPYNQFPSGESDSVRRTGQTNVIVTRLTRLEIRSCTVHTWRQRQRLRQAVAVIAGVRCTSQEAQRRRTSRLSMFSAHFRWQSGRVCREDRQHGKLAGLQHVPWRMGHVGFPETGSLSRLTARAMPTSRDYQLPEFPLGNALSQVQAGVDHAL